MNLEKNLKSIVKAIRLNNNSKQYKDFLDISPKRKELDNTFPKLQITSKAGRPNQTGLVLSGRWRGREMLLSLSSEHMVFKDLLDDPTYLIIPILKSHHLPSPIFYHLPVLAQLRPAHALPIPRIFVTWTLKII